MPRTKKAHSTRPSALLDQPQEVLAAAAAAPLLRFDPIRFATTAPRHHHVSVSTRPSPFADHAHFGFQSHSALLLDAASRQLDQAAYVFGACAAEVDDEIRMLGGKRRRPQARPFESRVFEQPPGECAGRVLEN